jgi:hypothetical protein
MAGEQHEQREAQEKGMSNKMSVIISCLTFFSVFQCLQWL